MAQEKLTILHILGDYKFYLTVSAIFDQSKYYNNVYVYKTRNKKDIECKKIEERAKDVIISEHYHEILSIIQTRNIDIVYFHGLAVSRWKFVAEIPKSKIIIWWAWGFDLYENYGFIPPLIEVETYKPLTKKLYIKRRKINILNVLRYIASIYFAFYKDSAMSNISFVQTVLDEEFPLIKAHSSLSHIKRFYAPSINIPTDFTNRGEVGYILVGNSAIPSNNHLDIIESLSKLDLTGRTVIMPVSYGEKEYKLFLKKKVCKSVYPFSVNLLEDFMSPREYDEVFKNISHAIFGVTRQKAIGNIRLCLTHGIKVFLYRDSIPFIDLRRHGYIIFSIEDDLTKDALSTPLTRDEAYHNFNLWVRYNKENSIKADDVAKQLLCG